MEELTIDEIINIFESAARHGVRVGRINGKHGFSKVDIAIRQVPKLLEELKRYKNNEKERHDFAGKLKEHMICINGIVPISEELFQIIILNIEGRQEDEQCD